MEKMMHVFGTTAKIGIFFTLSLFFTFILHIVSLFSLTLQPKTNYYRFRLNYCGAK